APELMRRKVQELGLRPLELDHPVGVLTQARRLRIALRVAALLRPVSLGEVARHLAETAQVALVVAKCGDDHVGPEAGSVLADAPPLLLVPALSLGDLELPIRLSVPGIVGRVENGKVPPDYLVGSVSLDPLRALVPRDDDARGIEHEDRVVDHARNEQRELIAEHPRLRGTQSPQHQPPMLLIQAHTARATRPTSSSLRRWSSGVNRLPSIVDANPHCGLRARRSRGRNRDASWTRRFSSSSRSSAGFLLVTRPSTTTRSSGTCFSGSNP